MNLQIERAIAFATLTGNKTTRLKIGEALFPDDNYNKRSVKMNQVITGKRKRFTADELSTIADITGVPVAFIIDKMNIEIIFKYKDDE